MSAVKRSRGLRALILFLFLLVVTVAALFLVTERGRCEASYWTQFRLHPSLESAARLKVSYPGQARAEEVEDWAFAQCTTPLSVHEYLSAFQRGKYHEAALAKLLPGALAAPDSGTLLYLVRQNREGATAAKARIELSRRSRTPLAKALVKYLGESRRTTLSVFVVTHTPDKLIQNAALDALKGMIAQAEFGMVQSSEEDADIVVEIEMKYAGLFAPSSFTHGVVGYHTYGRLRLKDGSWTDGFSTNCPTSANFEMESPRYTSGFQSQFQEAPPDTMIKVNAEQVRHALTTHFVIHLP